LEIEDKHMFVNVFRRDEGRGKFSHLVVPVGKNIPQEVTNWDWHDEERNKDLNEDLDRWPEYGIEAPGRQLKEKGYAITSLHEMTS